MRHISLVLALLLGLSGLLGQDAQANIGEAYGFGSRDAALAGSTIAGIPGHGTDGFASYVNPATLPTAGDKRLTLSYGLLYMDPKFTDINGVVVENSYTSVLESGNNTRSDTVDTSYRDTFGQLLGATYRVAPETLNLTIGLSMFLPVNQLSYVDTGETFEPEYVLYRARTQRPQFEFGIGADLGKGFQAGLGLHTTLAVTGNTTIFIRTDGVKPSSMRFSASVKPKGAPYVGLLYTHLPEDGANAPGAFSIGAVYRFPVASDNDITVRTGTAIATITSLDFNFDAASAIFYDPPTAELGTTIRATANSLISAQVDYEIWQAYQAPAMQIQNGNISSCQPAASCGITISSSQNPAYSYRNILVPRFGYEWNFSKSAIARFGYAYRPSFMTTPPNGAGNYLDPPKHMFNAGVGFELPHLLGFEVPYRLDVHASYQLLVTQTITKTAGDESGNTSSSKIGAPGYNAGGRVLGGGVDLTVVF